MPELGLSVECPVCAAPAGVPCETVLGGEPMSGIHNLRVVTAWPGRHTSGVVGINALLADETVAVAARAVGELRDVVDRAHTIDEDLALARVAIQAAVEAVSVEAPDA